VFQCLPEGRLDDVDVGENGDRGPNGIVSGINKGGDLEGRCVSRKLYGS
jgi:hypothetical protein